MDELKILCDLYIKPGQQRDKKKKATFSLEWQFYVGRSIRAKTTEQGNPTWCHEHNFKAGKGVYLRDVADSTKSPQQKILYTKACELLSLIDPDYAGDHKDFVINFSCMSKPIQHYVKKHTDAGDIQFQYALVLGDCTGGDLKLWDSRGNEHVLNYHNKILKLDGRLPHEVMPFTGRRYCIIWYKVFDRRMTRPAEIFEPAEIIYERQAVNPMNNSARSGDTSGLHTGGSTQQDISKPFGLSWDDYERLHSKGSTEQPFRLSWANQYLRSHSKGSTEQQKNVLLLCYEKKKKKQFKRYEYEMIKRDPDRKKIIYPFKSDQICGRPMVTFEPFFGKISLANTTAAYEILKWRDDDGTMFMIDYSVQPSISTSEKDPGFPDEDKSRIVEYQKPVTIRDLEHFAYDIDQVYHDPNKKWIVISCRDGDVYATIVLVYWMMWYQNMKCDEALKLVEESYRKASQFFRGTDPEILNDYAKYITLLKENQGLHECSVECDKRHEAFICQHVKSVMEKLIDDVVEADEKQKKQEAFDRQRGVKGVMDDLINAVIEANPRAEMSEVPPPKKARTTPTDTIETMEEPDSKIGTTIPKSETQSEAPPLKKKCSKSAVTTKCIYHEDVTLYNGIDDVKCLGQPGNKSKKTAWARMRQGIDLLDRVVNKD